jgi:hypothetical protein
VANEDKTFEQYFNEFSKSLAQTAFPQLSKFMSFDTSKKQDEDRASKSVDDQESADRPRSSSNKSVNAVANEMVLDALGGIDERLKVQSIVLVSQLEQQTLTNQLLNRLATEGGGFGGGGNSRPGNGGGGGPGLFDAVGSYIKSAGAAVLGGLSTFGGAALTAGAAAGSLIYGDISGNAGIKKIYDKGEPDPTAAEIQQMQVEANKPKIAANNTQIKDMEDTISKIENHLKISNASEEERAKETAITVELQKKINELQKQNIELAKTAVSAATAAGNSGPHPVVGPSKANTADVPTAVSTPMDATVPIKTGDSTAPSNAVPVPEGQSPLSMVRTGQVGSPVGGGGDDIDHPAGIGGYRSTAAKGSLAKNQQLAYAQLIKEGVSEDAARIIVGGLSGESLRNPADIHRDPSRSNPNQMAHGMASWDDARWAAIGGGKAPGDVSVEDQTHGLVEEMKKNYPKVWADLNNPKLSAEQKMHSYVGGYEKPRDVEGETAKRMGYTLGFHPNTNQGDAAGQQQADLGQGGVMDKIARAKELGLVNGDECVALAAGAVGVRLDGKHGLGSRVQDWRRGEDVLGSNLKPGTAVATFLDRQGRASDTYAKGGNGGQPGAHLDHAGVIVGYDKDGKGFTLADQWGAHNGHEKSPPGHQTHVRDGGIDPRTGRYNAELDPKSYAAIKTTDGRYLGHSSMNAPPKVDNYRPEDDPRARQWTRYRPEDDKNANLDANIADDAKYKAQMDAYNEKVLDSRRGISGYGRPVDKGETVAGALVKNSNADAMKDAADKAHSASVNATISNPQSPPGQLTGPHKSDRMSNKDVGSPNPPPARIKELFTTTENGKGF